MAGPATMAGAAARLDAVAKVLSGNLERPAGRAGLVGKRTADTAARSATGGSGRLSRMGKRGVKLAARYDVEAAGHRITFKFRPPGAWLIAERGARPHTISPKARRARAADHHAAIKAPGYATPVNSASHPGAPGRRALTDAFAKLRRDVPAAFHDALVLEWARIYGG